MDEAKHKAQEIGMNTLEWTRRIITLDWKHPLTPDYRPNDSRHQRITVYLEPMTENKNTTIKIKSYDGDV